MIALRNYSCLRLWAAIVLANLIGHSLSLASNAISRDLDTDLYRQIQIARENGMSEGEILEQRIIRALQLDELDFIVALHDDLQETELPFGPEYLFHTVEERDGFVLSVEALFQARLEHNEAFLVAAEKAQSLAPDWTRMMEVDTLLEERRQLLGGQDLSLDLHLRKIDGTKVTLGELLAGKKALVFDFWASWCGPCIRAMPELKDRAEKWGPQGFLVAGVNTDESDQKSHAQAFKDKYDMEFTWLLEPPSDPLSGPLAIDSIPRVIVINPNGKVLFNGHPNDTQLIVVLTQLGMVP